MTELEALGVSFLRHLRAEGRAERTGVLYMQGVRFFARWLEAQGIAPTVEALTRDNIRSWLAELMESKRATTVKTRYRSLYRFCGWLVDEGELEAHPMTKLAPPTLPAEPVPVLTDDELRALLKACGGKSFDDARDTAMIRLLLDCGLRVSELCGMTVAAVDLDNAYALVRGKGGKVRPVYFSPRTVAAVDRYLRRRRAHRWAAAEALILSQRGPMSPDGVRDRLTLLGGRAGVPGLHPHRFRHTWAHDYLLSGGQERDLKRLAGWSSDVMLERYGASAADSRARAAAQRMKRGDRV